MWQSLGREVRGGGGASRPSSLPPPVPGLRISLPLPGQRSWWGPQELPWTLDARPRSSWAPPVTLHPEGRPFEPLRGGGGHGVARGTWSPAEPGLQPAPTPALNTALTSRAAKATRNPGVVIQQAQTGFVPRGTSSACWLPPDVFHSFLYSQCRPRQRPFSGSRRPEDPSWGLMRVLLSLGENPFISAPTWESSGSGIARLHAHLVLTETDGRADLGILFLPYWEELGEGQ